jgi:hypothetical protein
MSRGRVGSINVREGGTTVPCMGCAPYWENPQPASGCPGDSEPPGHAVFWSSFPQVFRGVGAAAVDCLWMTRIKCHSCHFTPAAHRLGRMTQVRIDAPWALPLDSHRPDPQPRLHRDRCLGRRDVQRASRGPRYNKGSPQPGRRAPGRGIRARGTTRRDPGPRNNIARDPGPRNNIATDPAPRNNVVTRERAPLPSLCSPFMVLVCPARDREIVVVTGPELAGLSQSMVTGSPAASSCTTRRTAVDRRTAPLVHL